MSADAVIPAGLVLLFIVALLFCVLALSPATQDDFNSIISNLNIDKPVDTSQSHAGSKHGAAGMDASKCAQNGGAVTIRYNMWTGRDAVVCLMPDGRTYGIEVLQDMGTYYSEITAFPKEGLTFDKVVDYLIRRGYEYFVK